MAYEACPPANKNQNLREGDPEFLGNLRCYCKENQNLPIWDENCNYNYIIHKGLLLVRDFAEVQNGIRIFFDSIKCIGETKKHIGCIDIIKIYVKQSLRDLFLDVYDLCDHNTYEKISFRLYYPSNTSVRGSVMHGQKVSPVIESAIKCKMNYFILNRRTLELYEKIGRLEGEGASSLLKIVPKEDSQRANIAIAFTIRQFLRDAGLTPDQIKDIGKAIEIIDETIEATLETQKGPRDASNERNKNIRERKSDGRYLGF